MFSRRDPIDVEMRQAREDYIMGRTTVEYFEQRVEWILRELGEQQGRFYGEKVEWLE
jgi:hypothetical protein